MNCPHCNKPISKKIIAKALGNQSKAGKARMNSLTKEERTELALKAIRTRFPKNNKT